MDIVNDCIYRILYTPLRRGVFDIFKNRYYRFFSSFVLNYNKYINYKLISIRVGQYNKPTKKNLLNNGQLGPREGF